mmetsp:Transcript_29655/g.114209  ORF Transcript_29655/g.114209 Transcript_29655/m.114209 type:complete len:88 (+) Transcript_29655:576-839(+)|eukprot:CAMPEP_0113969778 /NCGR_PEP_ID=MMETSP0011_2-20120614/10586_1 /TAXON_ID=101924 /ORGANISM="Rhodosorus marinus" /LENGTH=87 /DNA_ID=CAMNT_0000983633 /DNA_START=31 /DNA_END=294 /DNA_ORIENTATION=- /assembly_acc=CAM_ASM_000156
METGNYTPEATNDSDTATSRSSGRLGNRSLQRVSKLFQRKNKSENSSKRSLRNEPRADLTYYPEEELVDFELNQQMWVYGSSLMTPF